jgi:hypothetical protein
LLRHSSHSPSKPAEPPQAHLHCKRPVHTGVKEGLSGDLSTVCNYVLHLNLR